MVIIASISLLQFGFISGQVTSEVVCGLNETAEFRCTTIQAFTDWYLNNATIKDGVDGDVINRSAEVLYCSAGQNNS